MKRSRFHLSLIAVASILFVGLLFTPSAQAYRGCYTTGCCYFSCGEGVDSGGSQPNPNGNCACYFPGGCFFYTGLCSNGTLYCN
jgi:hypothetical protein